MKLSDAFETQSDKLELAVHVYNLADGMNKEVIDMFGFEWNEKEEREALLEIGEERGRLEGKIEGKLEGKIESIKELMRNLNLSPEKAMTALGIAPSEFSRYLTML